MGAQEWIIIIGVGILLFGARKLPELGKSLGEGIKEFKKASKNITGDDTASDETSEEAPKA